MKRKSKRQDNEQMSVLLGKKKKQLKINQKKTQKNKTPPHIVT